MWYHDWSLVRLTIEKHLIFKRKTHNKKEGILFYTSKSSWFSVMKTKFLSFLKSEKWIYQTWRSLRKCMQILQANNVFFNLLWCARISLVRINLYWKFSPFIKKTKYFFTLENLSRFQTVMDNVCMYVLIFLCNFGMPWLQDLHVADFCESSKEIHIFAERKQQKTKQVYMDICWLIQLPPSKT